MTISEFAAEKVAVAKDFRGLSKINPVEFTLENSGKQYILICSEAEPDTVTIPFNVLWINCDEQHPDFLVILRRVDAEKYDDSNYRGTWSVISSVPELYSEDQYYKNDSDPILGEIEQFRPAFASTTRLGGFYLTTDSGILVGDNDERMSDEREPTEHTHPDVPRTMLQADGAKHVTIFTNDPAIGDILVVTSVDDGGNYVGEWVSPAMEFPYIGPIPTSISVVGPMIPVDGNTGHVLRADVQMSDGQILRNVYATWTVDDTESSAIGRNTGVFRSNYVPVDTVVNVTATWTHAESGTTVTVEFPITILGDSSVVQLSSISISGRTRIEKGESEEFTVVATYSDGSQQTVVPHTFTSSNPSAGTFANGQLVTSPTQIGSVNTTLTAAYTENSITRMANLQVTVVDDAVYPETIVVSGPRTVDSDSTGEFTAILYYTDGAESADKGVWSVEGQATISQDGVVTPNPITAPGGDRTITVIVTVIENGVTVTQRYDVAIIDVNVWPVSAAVAGPTSMQVGTQAQFTYTVTYSDGTSQVKQPTWSVNANGTINATGLFEAENLSSSASATITAVYSEKGVQLNRNRTVSILAEEIVLAPARLGVAKFANRNFTGGLIESEITQEEYDWGADKDVGMFGTPYDRWTGFVDFAAKEMTEILEPTTTDRSARWTGPVLSDEYVYFMWDARAGNISIQDGQGFTTVWTGVNHRTPQLGNEEGFPEYDSNMPNVLEVMYDDGSGERLWKVVKLETTPLPEASPLTLTYTFQYV